jgi:para-nitrobenzyl esterase
MELVNADKSEMSEDCLYLNIRRPAKAGVFPVMVWIHGGGYAGGTGSSEFYYGGRLSETGDLVVVTINYRLNAFGFLALPALAEEDEHGSAGSYGSLDQVAALRWVHENIAKFRGDPGNVTIFGESAGGWSICTMVATPLAKGLFQRAILESGGCLASTSLEKGFEQGREAALEVGCDPDDLECLRTKDAKKVLEKMVGTELGGFNYVPRHEGYLLWDSPLAMIQSGRFNNVPFMAGSNRDEANALSFLIPLMAPNKKKRAEKLFRDSADKVKELYPDSEFKKPKHAYGQAFTDNALACPTYDGMAAVAGYQAQAYYYRFDFDDMRYGKYIGALHAMEIPFIFDSLDRSPMNLLYPKKKLPEARKLVPVIQGYWINFAKTGDPNGPGPKGLEDLPEWPEFRLDNQKLQVLDVNVRTEPVSEKFQERCAFWSDYMEDHPAFYETMMSQTE